MGGEFDGIPLSPTVTSPFSRGTRDSSALTGTSSGRGGSGEGGRPYGWGGGLGKGKDCGKGVDGLTVWKRGRGDVGGDPYGIPPALRATSLFKGGLKTPPPCRAPPLGEEARANGVRTYGETVLVWEMGWGDVGIAPYGIPPALRATSLFKGGLKIPPPCRAPPLGEEAFGRRVFAPTLRTGKE